MDIIYLRISANIIQEGYVCYMYSQDFINKSINRQLQIQFNDLFYIE